MHSTLPNTRVEIHLRKYSFLDIHRHAAVISSDNKQEVMWNTKPRSRHWVFLENTSKIARNSSEILSSQLPSEYLSNAIRYENSSRTPTT